jgi:arginyl-tRNA synthetase
MNKKYYIINFHDQRLGLTEERLNNVLDEIDGVLGGNGIAGEAGLAIPHHPGRHEFSLRGSPHVWSAPGGGRDALSEIGDLDAIGALKTTKDGRVGLSLADSWVAGRGALLESGSPSPMETGDLAMDERYVIDFCDPNASKALHVGHLRNLAIGNALAAMGRTCGASVVTQSQVGDIGRSMGEAMAGYTMFGQELTGGPGQKGDHLVGECYSRFVGELAAAGPQPDGLASDPVLSREEMGRDDLASALIGKWRSGDDDATALWRKIRGWAMEGQAETLARLGVQLDRLLFESDYLTEIDAAGDHLLRAGVAEATESEALLHPTGDESYPYMVLRRPDGHSTQHLRYYALWSATHELLGSATSIQVMGDEWLPLTKHGKAITQGLSASGEMHPTRCVLHGMVTVENEVVKSSGRSPWLIDDLLDGVAGDPRLMEVCEGDGACAERLAGTIALGSCLSKPPASRMSISRELLFDTRENLGWTLATAAVVAWHPSNDGEPEPAAEDRQYRFLVAQSQVHRRLARRALLELDPTPLALFHTHLARWFLASGQEPRLARAMRTILASGMASLGMPAPVLDGVGSTAPRGPSASKLVSS